MGIFFALLIIFLWMIHLVYSLFIFEIDFTSVFTYLHIILQAYLFTGLFITAHDAIHGSISRNSAVNKFFGRLSAALYACMSYNKLLKNHRDHHKYPGTEKDPDYSVKSQNFLSWWFSFMKHYSTVLQFIGMAVIYNVLKIFVPETNIILLWVVPAFLSTFQLFYFGTYIPHKTPHTHEMIPHNARTQKKNFIWGLLSCYFFGFHFEHHQSPYIPWWKLYFTKK